MNFLGSKQKLQICVRITDYESADDDCSVGKSVPGNAKLYPTYKAVQYDH